MSCPLNSIYVHTFKKRLREKLSCFKWGCLLSHFSHVQLFATPWTVAHQASLSMGILQARILEWVAMPSSNEDQFSSVQSLSRVRLCVTPQTTAHQAPPSLGFSRQDLLLFNHKKNEIMPLAAAWVDLEMIILSEESQTGKDKCPMISLIGRLQNMIQMNLSMKQK